MQPKVPNKYPDYAANCDPRLPELALKYRQDRGLMNAADFAAYNVSVWRLDKKGEISYVAAHNRTIKELEKVFGPSSTKTGLHAEALAADEVFKRRDVLAGETLITQIFTERIPCSVCHRFLEGLPLAKHAPRYYYLNYSDREWQRQQAGGHWGLLLMKCYRLE